MHSTIINNVWNIRCQHDDDAAGVCLMVSSESAMCCAHWIV